MHQMKRINDSVHWWWSQVTSRIIAESGIPSDRFHLGKILLQSMKDAPDLILQIDGATGKSETSASVLERSIQCANSFRKIGLQRGDVIVLMAPHHLDLAIPYYAALFLGIVISAVDRTLTVNELDNAFGIGKPKVVFCQNDRAADVRRSLNNIKVDAKIVTFDNNTQKNMDNICEFSEFVINNGSGPGVKDFKAADFDPEETIAFIIATSGTTGLPKAAAGTHKNFAFSGPYWWIRYNKFPSPIHTWMVLAPIQWLSAIVQYNFSPLMRYTRLQTSAPVTQEHFYHLINSYKPQAAMFSPTMLTSFMKPGQREQCDFTCFEFIQLSGSAVPTTLVEELKKVAPKTDAYDTFGMSELTGVAFVMDNSPVGSAGKPLGHLQYRLVNIDTLEDVTDPKTNGELWLKGPSVFKGYYNNPKATEETFGDGDWFRTGDIFYRDENWNFFFVDRYKLLLKYKSDHISPVEVEAVIRKHPAVLDVAVTSLHDPECGDLPAACVVKRSGHTVSAQDIKDIVKESLSDSKQLRGGVIFVSSIPMTASTKVHRQQLKEMVLQMKRE